MSNHSPRSRPIRKAHLERHNTGTPSLSVRLVDARAERRRSDEAVRGVCGAARLADDELLQVDAVGCDLEERRLEEG